MEFWENDTIAAISTPIGESGIGIVRLSGPKAIKIAQKVYRDKKLKKINIEAFPTCTAHYGLIVDPNNEEIIDEIILILMKKPKTYTKEDIVEFNCHGGILPLRKVLGTLIDCGARLAEPGEFTKRAFLNGRIDLSQAEAVIDLIQAKTDKSLQTSLAQLEGNLKKKINNLRDKLVEIVAKIEAPMDFPDQDIDELNIIEIQRRVKSIQKEVTILLNTLDYGKILREGINTVIIGKANVGKSSLFNTLLKESRSIVTPLPGTTRDTIEELINIKGIAFRIIDTAGLKNPENVVEEISLKRMKKYLERADLILAMFDVNTSISEEDMEIIQEINKARERNKKAIIIENKIDLKEKIERQKLFELLNIKESVKISLKDYIGIEQLEEELANTVFKGVIIPNNGVIINNIRQADALKRTKKGLEYVLEGIKKKMPYDLLTIDLKDSLDSLGEITGDSVNEEIIDNIFSRFCIGK
ncbi:MAG TPA: tRNA uridine-5-carboxymethylaminomethyl(34) synthesis GTPase MnmE [Candidatus Atribacteria bacterium]|nr:tRNA uridine-5-carboxymethylaminomethyl(34) synthesis GTPase MnmE [Candidatus Atribacteria bacterium]